jgi:RHS repeat-associated protein
MAVYNTNNSISPGNSIFNLTEHHLYGSIRLGIFNRSINADSITTGANANLVGTTYLTNFTRGYKFFELSNHLGNVLATISDKKIGHDAGNGTIDYYNADVVSANDYTPFGMPMVGRTFSTGSKYRYGFNGKENDGETKTQDYGMRIYNPALGKFLSIDPITDKYPSLTPYQFASNRPIDGKDLDGLEYVTYIVNIYQYANGGTIQVIDYKWFNDLQHNECGEFGQGVTYDIRVHTPSGAAFQITPFFVERQDMANKLLGVKGDYGNYMGSTSLYGVNSNISTKNFDNSKILSSKYNYDLPAVDQVDEYARIHDQGYDALDAKGKNSLFNDWSTTPVDDKALQGWKSFLIIAYTAKTNGIDPFNKQPINDKEVNAALRGHVLFSKVVNDKLNGISEFMKKNYSKEATNDRENNYNLFLNKYMHQEKDGTWKRNEALWTKQKDGTYTPIAPNK